MSVETELLNESVKEQRMNQHAVVLQPIYIYIYIHTYLHTYHSFKISGSRNSPDLSPAPLRAAPTPDTDPTATITHTHIDTPIHIHFTMGKWFSR